MHYLLFLLIAFSSCAQASVPDTVDIHEADTLKTVTGSIYGTLTLPDSPRGNTVALIIAGSGPTDRDGNNPMMKNNSLLMLSYELAHNGIATLRYDKRGIAKSMGAGLSEADLRFENYIDDAVGWINWLKQTKHYDKVIVIGHSEGALIGSVAVQKGGADAFISLAGAGFPADKVLRTQLHEKAQGIADDADKIIDTILMGRKVEHVDQKLFTLFRPSVQPYLQSWFKYDPSVEIAKVKIPVLILQGTSDIQVTVDNAKALAKAKPDAKLVVIDSMNHVLKSTGPTQAENMPAYTNPKLPIVPQLPTEIVRFIDKAVLKK